MYHCNMMELQIQIFLFSIIQMSTSTPCSYTPKISTQINKDSINILKLKLFY